MAFWNSTTQHPALNTAPKKATWITLAVVLVGGFEGLYLHPYRDVVGVKTVCYGATAADHVDLTRSYTKQECDDMLGNDLPKYDAMLQKCVSKEAYNDLATNPHRHVALVSFVYNLGPGPACKGKLHNDLNAGNIAAECHDLLAYNRAGGRVIKGLVTRRQKEYSWCMMKG
jgi:lysozyme